MKSLLITLFLLAPPFGHAGLRPFTSDGCSSSPDGLTKDKEFLQCCFAHDIQYWQGGTLQQKDAADNKFYACMKSVTNPRIASIYFRSVRFGSNPRTHLPWAWGYGWNPSRDNIPLSALEQEEIRAMKPGDDITIPLIKTYPKSLPKMTAFDLAMRYVFWDKFGSVGEVYALATWKNNKIQSVVDLDQYYMVTSTLCPQGYYLLNQARYEKLKAVELQNYGSCPEIK